MTTSVTDPAGGASGPGQGPVAAGSASHPALPEAGWDALAADGSVVRIRPIAADDEAALKAIRLIPAGPPHDWYARHLR